MVCDGVQRQIERRGEFGLGGELLWDVAKLGDALQRHAQQRRPARSGAVAVLTESRLLDERIQGAILREAHAHRDTCHSGCRISAQT